MKKCISFVFVACMLVSQFSCNEDDPESVFVNENACIPSNLQSGLIAAYSFKNGGLNDLVGSAHLSASNAQPTTDRQGNPDCAFAFEGNVNSYLTSSNTDFLNGLEEMTVALWYLPQDGYIGYESLIGRGEGYACDTYGEWSLGIYDGKRAVFGHGNSVWEEYASVDLNQWKFVTATVNKADNTITIYVNGTFEQTATGTLNCPSDQPMTVEDIGDLLIGVKFKGSIDDVVIYNRILTPAEITQLYELAPCCQQKHI